MVKTLRLSATQAHESQRLDAARISGISSAIALHFIALGLLMMPAQVPIGTSATESRTRFEPVFREALPPPPPPIPVDVVERPRVTPKPATPTPPQRESVQAQDNTPATNELPSIDAPVIVDHGETVTTPPSGGETTVPGDGQPVSGITLQYLSNPKPVYPRDALRDGLQGTVMLRVVVDESGNPVEVSVATSSGHRVLDRAAREQVLRKWKFVPARQNGRAVRAVGTVPVAFSING